ncbi:hypothetical protein LCGC14_2992900, partial [marine sediment metagenome]
AGELPCGDPVLASQPGGGGVQSVTCTVPHDGPLIIRYYSEDLAGQVSKTSTSESIVIDLFPAPPTPTP